jgi:SAM-dependent methyltransferase
MLAAESLEGPDTSIAYYRNMYGPMRVEAKPRLKSFIHAGTVHGTQLTAPEAEQRPISYYSDQSAVGMVYDHFVTHEKRNPLKIGAIGLGTGTLATYSRGTNDMAAFQEDGQERSVTFYEIDPQVASIARTHFSYLAKAPGNVVIHFGDARTTLERQPPQQFDMLVVDAFTGDGIPIHLLTREALELYLRHVKPNGAILFHVSNHYLRLQSVVANTAHALGLQALAVESEPEAEALDNSDYVVVTAEPLPLESKEWDDGAKTTALPANPDPKQRVWTDDYSNLFSVLMRK